jgi:hypothetical protein
MSDAVHLLMQNSSCEAHGGESAAAVLGWGMARFAHFVVRTYRSAVS